MFAYGHGVCTSGMIQKTYMVSVLMCPAGVTLWFSKTSKWPALSFVSTCIVTTTPTQLKSVNCPQHSGEVRWYLTWLQIRFPYNACKNLKDMCMFVSYSLLLPICVFATCLCLLNQESDRAGLDPGIMRVVMMIVSLAGLDLFWVWKLAQWSKTAFSCNCSGRSLICEWMIIICVLCKVCRVILGFMCWPISGWTYTWAIHDPGIVAGINQRSVWSKIGCQTDQCGTNTYMPIDLLVSWLSFILECGYSHHKRTSL